MAFNRVGQCGDGSLSDGDSFLKIGELFIFAHAVANVVIHPRRTPQPLIIVAVAGERTFYNSQRLLIALKTCSQSKQGIGFLKRIGRFRLRESGGEQKTDYDD